MKNTYKLIWSDEALNNIKRIEESDKQIENGEFYSDEQVDKIIDKWLEE